VPAIAAATVDFFGDGSAWSAAGIVLMLAGLVCIIIEGRSGTADLDPRADGPDRPAGDRVLAPGPGRPPGMTRRVPGAPFGRNGAMLGEGGLHEIDELPKRLRFLPDGRSENHCDMCRSLLGRE
jgi:hypothetical protein